MDSALQCEVWKDIPGWEGVYKVSSTGVVVSLDREINGRYVPGRVLKQRSAKSDTKKVNLCTGTRSESVSFTVGHLVLLAFVGPPNGINNRAKHKDGVPSNNNLGNLYWGPHGPIKLQNRNQSPDKRVAVAVA